MILRHLCVFLIRFYAPFRDYSIHIELNQSVGGAGTRVPQGNYHLTRSKAELGVFHVTAAAVKVAPRGAPCPKQREERISLFCTGYIQRNLISRDWKFTFYRTCVAGCDIGVQISVHPSVINSRRSWF